jgi:hypothetical protein
LWRLKQKVSFIAGEVSFFDNVEKLLDLDGGRGYKESEKSRNPLLRRLKKFGYAALRQETEKHLLTETTLLSPRRCNLF